MELVGPEKKSGRIRKERERPERGRETSETLKQTDWILKGRR